MTPLALALPTVVVSVPLAVLAAALVVAAYALRGRRVDDHPLCRRCGFDLFGKPESSIVCSECGADLGRKRAVRVGNRVRRRRLFRLALPALLLCVGWYGVLGYGRAKGTEWNRYKPVWWLTREADGDRPAARDAALAEFARRIAEGKIEPADENALLDKALAHQADAARPWAPRWGEVVEAAHAAGRLSEERWQRYLLQAVTLSLEPAGMVSRRGYPLELRVRRGPDRVGAAGGLAAVQPPGYFPRVYANRTLFLGDRAMPAEWSAVLPGRTSADWFHPTPGPRYVADLANCPVGAIAARVGLHKRGEPPGDLADGPQSARVSLVVRAFMQKQEGAWDGFVAQPGERRVDLSAAWLLAAPPRVNADPSFEPGVAAALTVWVTEYAPDRIGGRPRVRYQIGCNGMPVDVAYDVSMRYAGMESRVAAGRVFFPRGGRGLLEQLDDEAVYFAAEAPEAVEVIFRPNPAAAPQGVTEVWGGEVVKEVRVKRADQNP